MSTPKITSGVERVDAAKAARWLADNAENRPIRRHLVGAYARDMASGNWRLTGEAIKFSNLDRLLDGQHRLLAVMDPMVVEAGVAPEMLVVRGLVEEVQLVMDSGARRTAADALGLHGETNSFAVAAAIRLLYKYETGANFDARPAITYTEMLEYLRQNPDIPTAVSMALKSRAIDMPLSVLTVSCLLLNRLDEEGCKIFIEKLVEGTDLKRGDPILALTSRLKEIRRTGRRANSGDYLSLMFRAWNYWRKGELVQNLPLRKGGAEVDIPVPR